MGKAGGHIQKLKGGGGTKKQREVDNSYDRGSVQLHQRKVRSQVRFLWELIKI